ncbi:MAG: PAS domain S-box protein [Peptococcaceae bacterium]|nr:PAS domain S-box protein [Peptococcaceae bacterium]
MTEEKSPHVLSGTFLSEEDNFRRTLLSVSDAVYLTDKERQIIFWNKACEIITGYSASEVLGRRCSDNILNHVDMEGRPLCNSDLCPLYQSITTGISSSKPMVLMALRKDKSRLAVEVSVAPLFDGEGNIEGGVEVFRDITEKQQLSEKKAQFLSSISHELKGPITIIQGFLELILSGSTGETNTLQNDFLTSAYKEGQRFQKILDDLSDLARFESTEFSFTFEPVDISELLMALNERNIGEATRKGLKIEMKVEEGIFVLGDWNRLYQAFYNIVSNAIKYTEKGRVFLSAKKLKDTVLIEIEDTGIGISDKDLPMIFEMFYRVDSEVGKKVGGTGIGLSIVEKIIQRHHGFIEVRSEPGIGSKFIIRLPILADN